MHALTISTGDKNYWLENMEWLYDPLIFETISSDQGNEKLPLFSIDPLTTEAGAPLQFFDIDQTVQSLCDTKMEDIVPVMANNSCDSSSCSITASPLNWFFEDEEEEEAPEFTRTGNELRIALENVPMTPFKRKFISDPSCRNNPMLCRKLTVRCPARGCGRVFQKVRDAVYHFDDHPERDKNTQFLCPYDGCPWGILGLSSKPSLCRHIGTVHEGHTIKCQRCWKEFKRLDGLTRHEQKNKCEPKENPDSSLKAKTRQQLTDEMFDKLQGFRL